MADPAAIDRAAADAAREALLRPKQLDPAAPASRDDRVVEAPAERIKIDDAG